MGITGQEEKYLKKLNDTKYWLEIYRILSRHNISHHYLETYDQRKKIAILTSDRSLNGH